MPKKTRLHLFLKITFFCSLLLLLTPETLLNHLFRQTNDQKWSKKLPKRTRINFLLFIIYFTFSLSRYGKKQNHLLFPLFLSPEIGKPQGKNVPYKIFFSSFFFLLFLHPTAPRNRKNYQSPFFSKFRLKVPKTAAKRAQFSFFTKYLVSAVITQTHTPTHTHSLFPTHNV